MKEEKKITQADIDSAKVQLTPLAGIPPRVYLPLAYALLLLLLLFLLLVLPGIRKYGSYLEFVGQPGPSAVYSGEDYKGSSAQSIFFPAGTHSLRIEHEGFVSQSLEVKVPGRLFGSLFFPRKQSVSFGLLTEDAAAYLQKATPSIPPGPPAESPAPSINSDGHLRSCLQPGLDGALYSKDSEKASQAIPGGEASFGLALGPAFRPGTGIGSASAESARMGLGQALPIVLMEF